MRLTRAMLNNKCMTTAERETCISSTGCKGKRIADRQTSSPESFNGFNDWTKNFKSPAQERKRGKLFELHN